MARSEKTEDRRQKTEVRRQKTEVRRQKTEVRSQKTGVRRQKTEGGGRETRLTHVDAVGRIRMVDVGGKPATAREAVARGRITISAAAMKQIRAGGMKKGDPLETARLAGIMAAKQTSSLIPLCHPLPLSHADVRLKAVRGGYEIEAVARTTAPTGVEMEALTAVAVAALTIYDMVKAVDKAMVIGDIRLVKKTK